MQCVQIGPETILSLMYKAVRATHRKIQEVLQYFILKLVTLSLTSCSKIDITYVGLSLGIFWKKFLPQQIIKIYLPKHKFCQEISGDMW